MTDDYENMSLFEQIKAGLEDGIAHARGELTLRTTTLPAPPKPMSRATVVRLRKRFGMSQRVFAAVLNVSPKLVQSWEQGDRTPNGGNLRLLHFVQRQPVLVEETFKALPAVSPGRGPRGTTGKRSNRTRDPRTTKINS